MTKYLILFLSVTFSVLASSLLKIGARSLNFEGPLLQIVTGYAFTPLIAGGFLAYALAAALWVYCLAKFDLSYVTFVASIQYILFLLVSIFVFQENISALKWAGCFFIMAGVACWLKG